MIKPEHTTVNFGAAASEFTDASERVCAVRLGAHQLSVDLEVAETALTNFQHAVTDSVAGQMRAPYDPSALTERTVEVLMADPQYLALMAKVQEIRTDIAQNNAELERARDQRSLAGRHMDYAVASAAAGEERINDEGTEH